MQPQFGEVESRSSPDAQLCTAVNGVQRKGQFNHLKQGSPKKIYNSSSVRCVGKIHTALHRRQTGLSFGTTFSQPPYPYAVALMLIQRFYGLCLCLKLLCFVFIESKPLVQEAGPRAVFRHSQITCCPVALIRRDTEVLRLRKCRAKRKGGLMAM